MTWRDSFHSISFFIYVRWRLKEKDIWKISCQPESCKPSLTHHSCSSTSRPPAFDNSNIGLCLVPVTFKTRTISRTSTSTSQALWFHGVRFNRYVLIGKRGREGPFSLAVWNKRIQTINLMKENEVALQGRLLLLPRLCSCTAEWFGSGQSQSSHWEWDQSKVMSEEGCALGSLCCCFFKK